MSDILAAADAIVDAALHPSRYVPQTKPIGTGLDLAYVFAIMCGATDEQAARIAADIRKERGEQ